MSQFQQNKKHEKEYSPKQCIYIIENIYRNHEENGFNELIPSWHEALIKAIGTLKSIQEKDETINEYIEYGEYLLKNMPPLTLNRLIL